MGLLFWAAFHKLLDLRECFGVEEWSNATKIYV